MIWLVSGRYSWIQSTPVWHEGRTGKKDWWLGLLLALVFVPCVRAVILEGTGDPSYNTNAPTGSLTNSGWQYEGTVELTGGGVFWVRPSPRRSFWRRSTSAASSGTPFVFNGVTYTTVTNFDDPSTDLRIWQVGQTFLQLRATVYRIERNGQDMRGDRTGLRARSGGGRCQRWDNVINGWQWTNPRGVQRWGVEQRFGALHSRSHGHAPGRAVVVCGLQPGAGSNECDVGGL